MENSRKDLLYTIIVTAAALFFSIFVFLFFFLLSLAIIVFTGSITVKSIIDVFNFDFTHTFPVIEGIFDGICTVIFLNLFIAFLK